MTARDLPGDAQALSDFFENAAIPMHWVDAHGTIVRVNRAELEMLGYAAEEYVGRSIAEFHADAPVIADILARLTRGETLLDVPARLRCKDGSIRDVRITSSVHRRDGEFLNTRCITRDVTDLKRAEALRAQSIDYLEGLMEGFVAYDADWVMTYMNAAAERILGRRREEVLGKTWHQAFPHAVGNAVDDMYQRVMRSRSAESMEFLYQHYGKWMEIAASPVKTGGVAVYFREITDRKKVEQALREEARTLETLNRVGTTLAGELDLERVVQAVTDAATEVSGAQFGAFFYNVTNSAGESYTLYSLSGVPREAFAKFPMPRNTAVFAPTFSGSAIVRSDDITSDPRYGRNAPHRGMPQGHLPVRSYLAVPVISRSGEVLGGLFFGHEAAGVFTERAERLVSGIAAQASIAIDNARLYQGLREADRRKDEFLATLAHELRNPLAPIRNGLFLLRMADTDSNTAHQARAMMERQVAHLVRLVDDLLELSRITRGKVELRRETLDLAAVVLSAVETSRPAVEAGRHKLDISLPAEPLSLSADFVRLAQVVANLLNNAAKYTDPGGHLSLAVKREDGHAVISVKDNGVGIAAEMLPKIFDMFSQGTRTLDRAQGGLGIGLSLSRNLVQLHGGTLEARSEGVGRGAEFIVRLPLPDTPPSGERKPFVALLS